ncbi:MAG: PQQ-dependent sugar dehydrogenase [Geminicoccaceae bacterium]
MPQPTVRAVLAAAALCLAFAAEASAAPCSAGRLTHAAALTSDWTDDLPGRCRQIALGDLPSPSTSNTNVRTIVPPPAGALPKVPAGFAVRKFYQGDTPGRLLRAQYGGDLFLAESYAGRVRVLRPSATCTLGSTSVFADGLNLPFGIAFYPRGPGAQFIYVAENQRIVRYPYQAGQLKTGTKPQVIASLPVGAGQLPGQGHWTRDIAFGVGAHTLYASIGSFSNAQTGGEDETGRAKIIAMDPLGGNRRTYATGLRNPVAISVSPVTGSLWVTTNERDGLGDQLVPDFVANVTYRQFYGWPWLYMGGKIDPRHTGDVPAGLPAVTTPSVLLQAHSASLGSAFYTGSAFPAEYRGSLFVALHGSWNRKNPIGPKVVRVPFDAQGRAMPFYEDFMTGFTVSDYEVWGRPVGVAVGKDGALYVSEDANRTIWCVAPKSQMP